VSAGHIERTGQRQPAGWALQDVILAVAEGQDVVGGAELDRGRIAERRFVPRPIDPVDAVDPVDAAGPEGAAPELPGRPALDAPPCFPAGRPQSVALRFLAWRRLGEGRHGLARRWAVPAAGWTTRGIGAARIAPAGHAAVSTTAIAVKSPRSEASSRRFTVKVPARSYHRIDRTKRPVQPSFRLAGGSVRKAARVAQRPRVRRRFRPRWSARPGSRATRSRR
jgi:hypothetical protein